MLPEVDISLRNSHSQPPCATGRDMCQKRQRGAFAGRSGAPHSSCLPSADQAQLSALPGILWLRMLYASGAEQATSSREHTSQKKPSTEHKFVANYRHFFKVGYRSEPLSGVPSGTEPRTPWVVSYTSMLFELFSTCFSTLISMLK